nr:C741 [uncultured bacterium]
MIAGRTGFALDQRQPQPGLGIQQGQSDQSAVQAPATTSTSKWCGPTPEAAAAEFMMGVIRHAIPVNGPERAKVRVD